MQLDRRCGAGPGGPLLGNAGGPDGRGVRVEPEADLAAALLDERREPIRKWLPAQPLTLDFRAEPALNRGTLPPGIVMRSPVRGFTPCRGPRSAT